MAISVIVPVAGESVTEGRIARWIKADGSVVKADEPLFEIETDKASQEVPAPVAGVLKITVPAGQIVKVGSTVGLIDPAGSPSTTTTATTTKPTQPHTSATQAASSNNDVGMSPAARVAINDAKLDPSKIKATGPNGLITKDDILTHQKSATNHTTVQAAAPAATATATASAVPAIAKPSTQLVSSGSAKIPANATSPRESRQPMTMIRRRIAERLLESQNTTATLTTFNEADMTAIQELRGKYNERFEKKHGIKLGFMSVFVKAAVEALKAFPLVNARIDGQDIVMQNFYDVGVAVSTEKGLLVPIIRDTDKLGFAEIEKAIVDVAKRARDGKVNVNDLQGGTFTITNGGTFGSMMSTPILNPPQSAILGMHAIIKRPVAINDQVVIRPMMYLALSYDHRIIDGRDAVQFLVRIKECVENPERLLLEI